VGLREGAAEILCRTDVAAAVGSGNGSVAATVVGPRVDAVVGLLAVGVGGVLEVVLGAVLEMILDGLDAVRADEVTAWVSGCC